MSLTWRCGVVTIKVARNSELNRQIHAARATGEPLLIDNGDEVIRLRVEPVEPITDEREPDDIWAGYDPEIVRESIRRSAGSLRDSGIGAEAWKAQVYRSREAGTRPLDHP
jgi:hypothetical protein